MESIFNQYSYILISLTVIIASAVLLRHYAVDGRTAAATLAAIAALSIAGHLLLRPGQSDVNSVEAARAALTNGKPTFMEFFSNYCANCLALRPAVDVLVADIEEAYNVLRIDIHTDFGRELRRSFQFSYTPEFVLFDSNGDEIWRGHSLPPPEQIYALAPELTQTTMTAS